ncbi:apolipoprotein N-acyltransferase [Methylomonas koyamae]|uniref:apolipoprotein N-acyltransferase n=1 Tax=Methylomonas koyamae TaxID=702114 RepID=UPI002873D3BA|nr:apolipoprotein N-acyltransferase [Methylomonas koyamae]WNB75123.1 apolipoprotein N-acyltransferase [Methylomonas koyamae]
MSRILQYRSELAALCSGGLLTLAFAPYALPYLAPVALIALYLAWQRQTPRRAAATAYCFGLGLFGSGIWWVYISIHDFGGADPASAAALAALLVAAWAGFPALAAWLIAMVPWPGAWTRAAGAALLWVAVEYFRGNYVLNGFPWLQIGYSQTGTPLAGFAALGGAYAVGFLLAFSAFAAAEMAQKTVSWRSGLALLLVIWGVGAGLRAVAWTEPAGAPIAVTLVQGNIGQDEKWLAHQQLATLNLYRKLTEQHWDSDVIIWPETAIPAFLEDVKPFFIDPLQVEARARGVDIVVGLPSSGQGRDYYNSVLALGETQVLYHKIHLLPFGEYLPLQPLSGWVLDQLAIPLGDFAAGGARQPLLRAGGHAFVATICYEDAFGELVARQAAEAGYIVNMTNDAWFGDSAQPHQHLQMAQMRALETGRYLVRATNTGVTAFIAPDGAVKRQAPLFATVAISDSIVPMRGATPYLYLGDGGAFAAIALLVLAVAAGERRFGLAG